MTEAHKKDFLAFEGNAQTLRLVTRLQLLNDDHGLNLTFGTLGALMKYPTTSDQVNENHVARKKHGVFHSELSIAEDIWLSADAAGITVCLFAYSQLSFELATEIFAEHFHWLRAFAWHHPEAGAILQAID